MFQDGQLNLLSRMTSLDLLLEQSLFQAGIGQDITFQLLRVAGGLPALRDLCLQLRLPANSPR